MERAEGADLDAIADAMDRLGDAQAVHVAVEAVADGRAILDCRIDDNPWGPSLEEIGGYFGGRDHTTVMHAVRTIEEKAGADQKLQAEVDRIEQDLLQRASR